MDASVAPLTASERTHPSAVVSIDTDVITTIYAWSNTSLDLFANAGQWTPNSIVKDQ